MDGDDDGVLDLVIDFYDDVDVLLDRKDSLRFSSDWDDCADGKNLLLLVYLILEFQFHYHPDRKTLTRKKNWNWTVSRGVFQDDVLSSYCWSL